MISICVLTQSYLWTTGSVSINFDYPSPLVKDLGRIVVHVNTGGHVTFGNVGVSINNSGRIWKKDETIYVELPAVITLGDNTFTLSKG